MYTFMYIFAFGNDARAICARGLIDYGLLKIYPKL